MSHNPSATADLENPEYHRHYRHEYLFERCGWGLLVLLLVASALGYLGPGPLTHKTVVAPDDSLTVSYYAVERYSAPGELQIRARPTDSDAETIELAIGRSFTDAVTPQAIIPPPSKVEAHSNTLVYTFNISELDEGQIVYRYDRAERGKIAFDMQLVGREAVHLWQFVLP